MAFPGPTRELAVDRPLKLGSTVQGDKRNGYYTFKYDFQPDSLQKAEQADIIIFGDETVTVIPTDLPKDLEFHYEGTVELLQHKPGADVECVAVFDGNEWTLELVAAHLRAKHRPGVPQIPGYNYDPDESGDVYNPPSSSLSQQHTQQDNGTLHTALQEHCQVQGQQLPQQQDRQLAGHDIDQDLNDALDEALGFACVESDAGAVEDTTGATHGMAPPLTAVTPDGGTVSPAAQADALSPGQLQPQQQQHHHHHQQQQQRQQDDVDDSDADDDPWNAFSAPPAVMKPPPLPSAGAAGGAAAAAAVDPPVVTVAQVPTARAVASAAAPQSAATTTALPTRVLQADEDDDDFDGHDAAVHHCSEDESDGVGVEVF